MAREYKDSGIEWIGRIPKEWKTCRFKDFVFLRTAPSNSTNKIGLENLEGESGHFVQTEGKFDGDGTQFYDGDVLYGKLRPYLRKVWLATFDGNAVGDFFVFKNKVNAFAKYVKWLFLSDGFSEAVNSSVYGAKMPRVSSEFILTLPYFLPSIDEQQRIADYLDEKCGEIDSLISLQEQMIAQLTDYKQSVITEAVTKGLDSNVELVPSGIDWIGDVPEGWKLARMDYICSVITDFVASGSFESLRENVPYLDTPDYAMLVRTADLSGTARSDKRVYISEHSYIFLKNSNLFGEEIVLPNIGASVGDVYMVPAGLYEKMSLGPNSIMLKTKYCDRYYYYYYYGEPGKRSVINMCQSTAQPKFNKTELRSLRVLLPPLEEQRAIASYLDGRCAEIDSLISLKQQKIEKLKEYKKSLIFEAVTGKKEIV